MRRSNIVMIESMQISPEYNVGDWKALRFSTEGEWQKAIDIFEDRIRGRFLDIIDSVENHKYAGFAVLALDCLLLETLQQFREGKAKTPKRKSKDYFVCFLTKTSFGNFFQKKSAEVFYDQIRCGILHQAETKGKSLIRTDVPLVSFTSNQQGLIVNRKLFHKQLVVEFVYYVTELRKNNPPNEVLRQNFKKKMDHICRVHSGTE